jgi:uncharacterized membrane protein YcaP (DUF421 family)
MDDLLATFAGVGDRVLGLDVSPADLTFLQMASRVLIVFIWGILIVRLGDRRLLGRNAGFDMLVVVILGSVLSRAVNGQAPFFTTLGACGLLVLFHHALAAAASRSSLVSRWVKGSPRTLVRNGEIDRSELRRSKITRDDLDENLRLNGNVSDLKKIREARLERNGAVSVVEEDSP